MNYLELGRRQRRWTQTQLGERTHISQGFISFLEIGRGIPTPDELQRIAHALDLPPELVLKPVDNPRQLHAQLKVEKLRAVVAQLEAEAAE